MAGSPERPTSPRPSATAANADMKTSPSAASKQPPSPSRSDRSTESEGRPVREKLQETRIDGQSSSDPPPSSDQPMKDAPNGTRAVNPGSAGQSTSGSDSERGRLRRKRSREDFEDEHEAEKHPEKKQERHTRKKSRDITSPPGSDVESLAKSSKTPVSRIDEQEGDENTKNREPTPEASASTKGAKSGISPKNKRTLEQTVDDSNDAPAIASEEGRGAKRQRDQGDTQDEQKGSKSKIPPSSGFGNNSAASPFAIASPKPQSSKISDNITDTAQTSEEKFKSSGFSTFSSASASPFSLGNSSAPSPFAPPTGGGKLSSFASPAKPSTPSGSGFGGLGSSTPTAFGGASLGPASGKSVFGATLGGSAFSTLGGTKSSLASFATPGAKGITGLSQKADKFGASGQGESESEDGSGDEGDTKEDSEKAKDSTDQESRSQNVLPGPVETGEEGEETVWSGRAKLYTLAGESGNKQWQERGMGPFKVNVTAEAPAKARFVLRADGTHRLLLNAAITKAMLFGDADGKEPTDGRLLFTAPTTDGQIESHLLRMKQDKARELYKEVISVQKNTL